MPTCSTHPGCPGSRTCALSSRPSTAQLNVLLIPGGLDVAALAEAGVARISVGGALAWVGWAAVADAARQLLESGTPFDRAVVKAGGQAAKSAFA